MADVGLVLLEPVVKLYVKYYIPPQGFRYAVNATKAQLEQSFTGYMEIVKEPTQLDKFELYSRSVRRVDCHLTSS